MCSVRPGAPRRVKHAWPSSLVTPSCPTASRGVHPHPVDSLEPVSELFTGSWIDEAGSTPGVDLGTWIGEPEEDRAWELLGDARRWLAERGGDSPERARSLRGPVRGRGQRWVLVVWHAGTSPIDGMEPAVTAISFTGRSAGVPCRIDATSGEVAPPRGEWVTAHDICPLTAPGSTAPSPRRAAAWPRRRTWSPTAAPRG